MIIGAELLLPGTSLANVLPALKYIPTWFPGGATQKKAAEIKKLTEEMKRIPIEYVKVAWFAELPIFLNVFDRNRNMSSPPSCQIFWRREFQLGRGGKRNAPSKSLPIWCTAVSSIHHYPPKPP